LSLGVARVCALLLCALCVRVRVICSACGIVAEIKPFRSIIQWILVLAKLQIQIWNAASYSATSYCYWLHWLAYNLNLNPISL
jgi:antirestriction protein ArdC